MQQFSAEVFYHLGHLLSEAKDITKTEENLHETLLTKEQQESIRISRDNRTRLLKLLEGSCLEIGLPQTLKSVRRLQARHESSSPTEILTVLMEVDRRISDEMEDHLFMHVPPTRSTRYDQKEAFGPDVAKSFSSAKFDIWEAGNCFAAARYTACVFHLMRVLELGLGAFAGIFNVPSDHANWHNIIESIERKIRDMGNDPNRTSDWKDRQELYSQIASSFMIFKDAWRNYTAHARGKYIEEEADAIYRNVGSFMKRLAEQGIHE